MYNKFFSFFTSQFVIKNETEHCSCTDTLRVSVLAAVGPAHVEAGLGDNPPAGARPAPAGPGAARTLLQVTPSERARHRRRLPPCALAAAPLLPILQVPRRSTRTLLAVNSTVTIIHPSLERSAENPNLIALRAFN